MSAKSPVGCSHQAAVSKPASASSRSSPARRNLELTSVRSSSPSANGTSRPSAPHARPARPRSGAASRSTRCSGSQRATCANRSRSKSASSSRFSTRSMLQVELGGDAGRVVVGGLEPADVLDEVGAEQQRLAGLEHLRDRSEEPRPLLRLEVADRRAEERDHPPVPRGQGAQVAPEVADDAVHLDARVLLLDRRRALAQRLLAHVEGHEAPQRPVRRQRVEQHARLVGGAGAELDERVRVRQLADLVGVLAQQVALALGRVVLGQARDRVEELRAALVVEPLRREVLGRRGQAGDDVLAQRLRPARQACRARRRAASAARRARRRQASRAHRKPAKSCRRIG